MTSAMKSGHAPEHLAQLISLVVLISLIPCRGEVLRFHGSEKHIPQAAQAKPDLMLYDGVTPKRIGTWSHANAKKKGASCKVSEVNDGERGKVLKIVFDPKSDWAGCGINLANWSPKAGVDVSKFKTLVMMVKVQGSNRAEPQFALSSSLPGKKSASTSTVAPRKDGHVKSYPENRYVQVRIPLDSFKPKGKFSADKVWEIGASVWQGPVFTLYLDDIGVSREVVKSSFALPVKGEYRCRLRVDSRKVLHRISPWIYGTAFGADESLRATVYRWGGNFSSRYNWKIPAWNHGADRYFLNDTMSWWGNWHRGAVKGSARTTYISVPILPWIAKDTKTKGDPARKDATLTSVPNSPEHQLAGLKKLVSETGGALKGGPKFYALDNEPHLWQVTHRDVHPTGATYKEVRDLSEKYALAILKADPNAKIGGPCVFGWPTIWDAGIDLQKKVHGGRKGSQRHARGGMPFVQWYLREFAALEKKHGKRLLHFVDFHWYPELYSSTGGRVSNDDGGEEMWRLRAQAARRLWDKTHKGSSWIKEPVYFIRRLREWCEQEYPGTGICIGEWDVGGRTNPSGAIGVAETLGAFARERLDFAYYWQRPKGHQVHGWKMFRNYDGAGAAFGEEYLESSSSDWNRTSVFAARRKDGATTILIINKETQLKARIALQTEGLKGKGARFFYYGLDESRAIVSKGKMTSLPDTLTIELAPFAMLLMELKD